MRASSPTATPQPCHGRTPAEAQAKVARLLHEMSLAPVGSKQRRFLRRAAERARARARLAG